MLKLVTLWVFCAIVAHGFSVASKPVMKIRAAVKARQSESLTPSSSPANAPAPMVAVQFEETKKDTQDANTRMVMEDSTPVEGEANTDAEDTVEVAPQDSNVPVFPTTSSDSKSASSDSENEGNVVSASFKSKGSTTSGDDETEDTTSTTTDSDAPIDSAVVHLQQSPSDESAPTFTASSPTSKSSDYSPAKTTQHTIAAGSDTVFVPPSTTEDTVPTSQIIPMSLASRIAQSNGQAPTSLAASPNPTTAPSTAATAATPTSSDSSTIPSAPASAPAASVSSLPTQQQQTTSPSQEVAPVFQIPVPAGATTLPSTPAAGADAASTTTPASSTPTPQATQGQQQTTNIPSAAAPTTSATPPTVSSPTPTVDTTTMKIMMTDAPPATPQAAQTAPATPATAPAAGQGSTQAFMAEKLAQAMALEKQREQFEKALHSADPEAARSYFQWQQQQSLAQQQQALAAQQEQMQTQQELRTQVLALQDQLEQTQQLLKTNIAKPTMATPAAPVNSVPMSAPSAVSGINQHTLAELSVNGNVTAFPTFFHTSKLIQPADNTMSLFFFTEAYCSGDFSWVAPPPSSMPLWSVGSWMQQDHATGTARSLMLCHHLPGDYQRIFQVTVWRAIQFQFERVDHIFYLYPGQCTCAGHLETSAFPQAEQVGSWKLAQI